MSAKRKTGDSPDSERVVSKRRALTLIQKIAILDRLAQGEGSTSVARTFGLPEGTVRSVKKKEDKIRSCVAAGAPRNAKMTFYARDASLQRMEKVLVEWINEQNSKGIATDGTLIRKEAKRLYDDFKSEASEASKTEKPTTFVASKGWFEKFKRRARLNRSEADEEPEQEYFENVYPANTYADDVNLFGIETASVKLDMPDQPVLDHDEAKKFTTQLMKIIDMKGFTSDQVFNAAEFGMYWKKMPKETFLSQEEDNTPGPRFSMDRLSLLLCANASGSCQIKPMAVYRTVNPSCLKAKNKHQLPVFWRANSSVQITETEFVDWFHNCFIPEVKIFIASKNIPFKVLLLLDTLSCHPFSLQDEDPNVRVVFFPENTAPLIQPFDQGLIGYFKANYTLRLFNHIIDAKMINPFASVSEMWWDFSMVNCLKIIKETLEAIRPTTINACWNALWKDAVVDLGDLPAEHHVVDKIVQQGHIIGGDGFKDLESTDIEELLESHKRELTAEELQLQEAANDEEGDPQEGSQLKNQLTIESLEKGFRLAKDLQDILFHVDPFMDRGFKSKKDIEDALVPYRDMYNDLQYNKSLLINNAVPKSKIKKLKRNVNNVQK